MNVAAEYAVNAQLRVTSGGLNEQFFWCILRRHKQRANDSTRGTWHFETTTSEASIATATRSEKFGAPSATAGVAVFTYLRGAALTLAFEKCSDRRLLVKARSPETLLDRSIAHVRKEGSVWYCASSFRRPRSLRHCALTVAGSMVQLRVHRKREPPPIQKRLVGLASLADRIRLDCRDLARLFCSERALCLQPSPPPSTRPAVLCVWTDDDGAVSCSCAFFGELRNYS